MGLPDFLAVFSAVGVQCIAETVDPLFLNTDCAISSEELQASADLSGYTNGYNYPHELFAQDHFLFYITGLSSMRQFSDMERVGAVMEYSAWLSHKTLLPAYYETTIKGKKLRDEKAYEMIDLIKSSILYDFSEICGLGGTQILYDGYKPVILRRPMRQVKRNY